MPKLDNIDYLLQHITSLSARNFDQILLEQLGVGYAQFKILRMIKDNIAVKQRYIADILGQTEASISRQIKILMSLGYVTRKLDPYNKRLRLVSITPKGLNVTNAALVALDKYHSSLLSGFDEKQQSSLLELLQSYHDDICNLKHNLDIEYLDFIAG
jgi:DNA-binding MarR family transcriptional regulator